MQRIAFTMKLIAGHEAEYKRRHETLAVTWPDLADLLKRKGIVDYSIFLDERSLTLFGYLRIENPKALEDLSNEPLMLTWWNYMKDLMETNEDHSPKSEPLVEVFYLA
jgi:L-rhamnose mutarotase